MEDSEETVSSRHNRMDAHLNSNRRWQHTQELQGVKTDRVPVLRGEVFMRSHPLTKKRFATDACWEREN